MPEIPKTYASPGLRWGLFLYDHPHAPDPEFRLALWNDPEVNVPEEFAKGGPEGFTGEFCVCTIDPGDGSPPIIAWREIPSKEKRGGSWQTFSKTPENWRKLTTMALGRGLKQAGYADDTEDLKALLLWRRRDVELRALAAGVSPPPAIGTGPTDADLDAAARTTPLAEHPEQPDAPEQPGDEEVVEPEDQWNEPTAAVLRPVYEALTDDQKAELQAFADTKGYGPIQRVTNGALRAVLARARSFGSKPEAPKSAKKAPAAAPEAPRGQSRPSGVAADDPAPPSMVEAVDEAFEGLDTETQEKVLEGLPDSISETVWDQGLTYGEVDMIWSALEKVGVLR